MTTPLTKLPPEFKPFQSIPRLSREMVITEKLDGTNASITITEDGGFFTGSRNRWITPDDDNYGFSRWAHEHKNELMQLGLGTHFGEWWGRGIQAGYGLKEKRFSLFNVGRWAGAALPSCVDLVPVLYKGDFSMQVIDETLDALKTEGSVAAGGFMQPEGIIIYHVASRTLFKKTIKHDEKGKSYGA